MASSKKNKRTGLSDKTRSKKGINKVNKPLNPFEVHINKEKFKILGKRSKNDKGLPGISRAKALKKRKETLGVEYKLLNKSNAFIDKRIGEKTGSLNDEDRALARFAAERIKQHKSKQSIFNLAEDEILTHKGQTLEEIEKFDDPRSDDEDDTEDKRYGGLQDEFVSEGHFGGGMLSRTNQDGAKSRKDLIDQLIAESKKRKAEKQKQRESTLDLTQKLDSEWQDLQPFVAKRTDDTSAVDSVLKDVEEKNADYDKTMRELKFEARGTPSDRLKSEGEIAKHEKEKLEKLEEERLARMHGVTDEDGVAQIKKHRSADDLDDGFELDMEPDLMVAYDADGNLLMPDNRSKKDLNNAISGTEDRLSEENSDKNNDDKSESEEAESDDESDENSEDSYEDLKEDASDDNSDEDNDTNIHKDDTNLVKANTKADCENATTKETLVKPVVLSTGIKVKTSIGDVSISDTRNENIDESSKSSNRKVRTESITEESGKESLINRINAELLARKSIMEQAAKELPFTFQMPDTYEELQSLLIEKTAEHQYIILERVIKCNHPSLAEANKEKLNILFAYLMQYINDIFSENTHDPENILNSFKIFDRICPAVYDLAHLDPRNASNCVLEVIKEKYGDFKNNVKKIPELDTLIFFKLVSLLFPTSDYRHPVVTPSLFFMEHILTKCRTRNRTDVSRGLFVVALILEYTVMSKRILTSAVTFLSGVLYMCVFTSILNSSFNKPPYKYSSLNSNLLVLSDDCSEVKLDKSRLLLKDLTIKTCDNNYKIRTLVSCVRMVKEIFDNCNSMTGQTLLFSSHIQLIDRLDLEMYPKQIAEEVSRIKEKMESSLASKLLEPLRPAQKKPKLLKLYEPLVEEGFTGKIRSRVSKEKTEHDKLVHKFRREKKGALREIRRDKAFIGSLKLKQKLQSDQVRKAKVQQIYKEASIQQGELNKLERKKK